MTLKDKSVLKLILTINYDNISNASCQSIIRKVMERRKGKLVNLKKEILMGQKSLTLNGQRNETKGREKNVISRLLRKTNGMLDQKKGFTC